MTLAAAGFVLAGGRSSRMGREKALLEIDGETLLARGLRQLSVVCTEVAIAGGSAELVNFGRLIPDENPGQGPLSGIIAALELSPQDWNLFCPVDVPFVPAAAWRRMMQSAAEGDFEAILARVAGQVQPLCGLYNRRAATGLKRQLQGGQRKVTAAIEAVGAVRWIDFDRLEEQNWFRNLNTPEDYRLLAHPKR